MSIFLKIVHLATVDEWDVIWQKCDYATNRDCQKNIK